MNSTPADALSPQETAFLELLELSLGQVPPFEKSLHAEVAMRALGTHLGHQYAVSLLVRGLGIHLSGAADGMSRADALANIIQTAVLLALSEDVSREHIERVLEAVHDMREFGIETEDVGWIVAFASAGVAITNVSWDPGEDAPTFQMRKRA